MDKVSNQIQPDFGALKDLQNSLPKICEMLNVKSVDDLHVMEFGVYPCAYMEDPKLSDKPLEYAGLPDMPWVAQGRKHAWWGCCGVFPGVGMMLYQARNNEDLKYIVFKTIVSPYGGPRIFHIIPRGKVARFIYHANRMEKLNSAKDVPLLQDGLLDDIAKNTVEFLLKKKELEQYDVKVRRGILLMGTPGNGKTMACRWIQSQCIENNIDYAVVNGAELVKAFNEGKPLDDFFNKSTVTFFDDIDIGFLVNRNSPSCDTRMACSMLSAMDGVKQSNHVIRIFSTNEEIDNLDPAFIRPGRIDRYFYFDKPTAELRRRLIVNRWHDDILDYLNSKDLLDQLVARTSEFSFAEIESIRSIMVTNKLLSDVDWDLEKAFEDFHKGKNNLSRSSNAAGFKAA